MHSFKWRHAFQTNTNNLSERKIGTKQLLSRQVSLDLGVIAMMGNLILLQAPERKTYHQMPFCIMLRTASFIFTLVLASRVQSAYSKIIGQDDLYLDLNLFCKKPCEENTLRYTNIYIKVPNFKKKISRETSGLIRQAYLSTKPPITITFPHSTHNQLQD